LTGPNSRTGPNSPPRAVGAAPATTPIESAPTVPVAAAAPVGPGSSGPSTKTKLIAGAVGGAVVVAGVFFGLGYWTGDATGSDHHDHHRRMSNEWRQHDGYGPGGPGMRHHMRGNEDMPVPPGMQAPGNGQVPGNGQQQAPNGNGAPTTAPAPSA
jgi:hypothetical protein